MKSISLSLRSLARFWSLSLVFSFLSSLWEVQTMISRDHFVSPLRLFGEWERESLRESE